MNTCLCLSRHLRRIGTKACFTSSLQSFVPVTTSAVRVSSETFIEKNERLKRPLSPHLTIYKFPLPAVMSITHRATGIVLTAGLYGFAIGMLALPAQFPYYFEYFQTLHIATPVIFAFKFALAWNLFYHGANGVRHLFWDMGYGYDLKNLYLSGYLVFGLSFGASLLAAIM